jgi:hypothetical protein
MVMPQNLVVAVRGAFQGQFPYQAFLAQGIQVVVHGGLDNPGFRFFQLKKYLLGRHMSLGLIDQFQYQLCVSAQLFAAPF